MKPTLLIKREHLENHPQNWIVLRRWQIDDAPALFKEVDKNRTHLGAWLPWVSGTQGVGDSLGFIEASIKAFDSGTKFEYGIFMRPDNDSCEWKVIGSIGFVDVVPNVKTEIGYWLVRDMEGQGIVTMAMKTLMAEGRNTLGIYHFVVKALEGNLKSRKVPERLGFVQKSLSEDSRIRDCSSSKMTEYHFE